MGNMGNTMCTTRACQISFIFPQLITMWCRRQHILFYKIVNSVLLKKKKKKKRKERKENAPSQKKNKTINNRRKTMMHAWTMLLQQRRITTIRWRIKPKTTTAGKWVTSSFSMFAYNTLERPPSQFCGVARQPKWDRNWGKRRKRKERQGRGGGTHTRHLSIHLVLHMWGWRAAADHTLRGHVVTVRRLRRGATLVHATRTHGHILSGRL